MLVNLQSIKAAWILIFGVCGLLYSCIFTYDPPRGMLHIRNYSDEAIYIYLKCGSVDSLPLKPELDLFITVYMNMQDANGNPIDNPITSPDYRINAYQLGSIAIMGTSSKPHLPCDEKEATLFFITEKTMRTYDWGKIYRDQLFAKKVILTEEQLSKNDWQYVYDGRENLK